jgi:hypothetical protein
VNDSMSVHDRSRYRVLRCAGCSRAGTIRTLPGTRHPASFSQKLFTSFCIARHSASEQRHE